MVVYVVQRISDDFINKLFGDECNIEETNFTIENRKFQKEFQPNGGVWRRLPVFLD